jgi:hypothetical protein
MRHRNQYARPMPAWATSWLPLIFPLIAGLAGGSLTGYVTQRMVQKQTRALQIQANRYDSDRQFRTEAYTEFNTFMLAVAAATDAVVFAARNRHAIPQTELQPFGRTLHHDSQKMRSDALVTDAVEKVRQVRIHAPLITAYTLDDHDVREKCTELVSLLGDAIYSLRVHAKLTTAKPTTPGTPWVENEIADNVGPADELQEKLAVLVTQAIRGTTAVAPSPAVTTERRSLPNLAWPDPGRRMV